MPTHLVTGGAGFIGSHIAEALVKRGDRVRALDNLSAGFRENVERLGAAAELIEGEVQDVGAVARAMEGVECVFHQAALASVPRSLENPLATNEACVSGTVAVLHAARKAGVKRVIYAASSSAYGDLPFSSKRESDLPMPLSPYAAAKLAGEFYCQAFSHSFGLSTVGLRYFNVFGPRQDPGSPYSAVIPIFITKLLQGVPPTIYGDGEQSRDFTFVENVVHGNLLAAEAEGVDGRILNVANGVSTSVNTMLARLNELLGTSIEARYEPPRPGDVRDSLADISAAEKLLGYRPLVDFDEGLRRSIDYYKSLV